MLYHEKSPLDRKIQQNFIAERFLAIYLHPDQTWSLQLGDEILEKPLNELKMIFNIIELNHPLDEFQRASFLWRLFLDE